MFRFNLFKAKLKNFVLLKLNGFGYWISWDGFNVVNKKPAMNEQIRFLVCYVVRKYKHYYENISCTEQLKTLLTWKEKYFCHFVFKWCHCKFSSLSNRKTSFFFSSKVTEMIHTKEISHKRQFSNLSRKWKWNDFVI